MAMHKSLAAMVAAAFATVLAGCAQAPTYQRPAVELPAEWRANAPAYATDGRWWRIYGDAQLERLVEEAFTRNTDLAEAIARVDEARALVGEANAALLPTVDGNLRRDRTGFSERQAFPIPPGVPRDRNNTRVTVNVSWEPDLWGRLRATRSAAQADAAASEAARDGVRLALAAQVAKSWYSLRALDEQVALTKRTLALRESSLALQKKRADAGLVSNFDYRQLEAEAAAARAELPGLERDREAEAAALAVLVGRTPKAIFEGTIERPQSAPADSSSSAPAAPVPATLPAGLPSELLLRRPDLVEAEQRLIAANARIAVARTEMFPSIPLTGFLGSESAALSNLFSGPAMIWQLAAAITQPIFAGGRLEARVQGAEARERQLVARYQGAIQNAFREVRVALAAQARARETYDALAERSRALAEAVRLARLRYDNGVASQLDMIDAERGLLAAELGRIDALRAQRAAVADLFRALGG